MIDWPRRKHLDITRYSSQHDQHIMTGHMRPLNIMSLRNGNYMPVLIMSVMFYFCVILYQVKNSCKNASMMKYGYLYKVKVSRNILKLYCVWNIIFFSACNHEKDHVLSRESCYCSYSSSSIFKGQ